LQPTAEIVADDGGELLEIAAIKFREPRAIGRLEGEVAAAPINRLFKPGAQRLRTYVTADFLQAGALEPATRSVGARNRHDHVASGEVGLEAWIE